jgi:hypothetical protein
VPLTVSQISVDGSWSGASTAAGSKPNGHQHCSAWTAQSNREALDTSREGNRSQAARPYRFGGTVGVRAADADPLALTPVRSIRLIEGDPPHSAAVGCGIDVAIGTDCQIIHRRVR